MTHPQCLYQRYAPIFLLNMHNTHCVLDSWHWGMQGEIHLLRSRFSEMMATKDRLCPLLGSCPVWSASSDMLRTLATQSCACLPASRQTPSRSYKHVPCTSVMLTLRTISNLTVLLYGAGGAVQSPCHLVTSLHENLQQPLPSL